MSRLFAHGPKTKAALVQALVEELMITPAKVGHVAPLSRELVRDSLREEAPEIIATAQGIDIAKPLEMAFSAATTLSPMTPWACLTTSRRWTPGRCWTSPPSPRRRASVRASAAP